MLAETLRTTIDTASEGVELRYSKKVLQQTVICFGMTKFVTVFIYVALFVAVYNSEVDFGAILQGLLLLAIVPSFLHGGCLIFAGMHAKMLAINASLWLALGIGTYDVVVGVFGACSFIKNSKYTREFLIQICFWVLAFNMIRVLCIDVIILLMFKKMKTQEGSVTSSATTNKPANIPNDTVISTIRITEITNEQVNDSSSLDNNASAPVNNTSPASGVTSRPENVTPSAPPASDSSPLGGKTNPPAPKS